MNCPAETLEMPRFLRRWEARISRGRIPFYGSMEITRRCNLRCVHCYLGGAGTRRTGRPEVSATEAGSILEQAAGAGCLFLLITGGEPLLRPDFPEIYAHARKLGMVVTVFTNATLVDDRVIGLFRKLPPHKVEVTLYGATPGTCDCITGVPGSYERSVAGILALHSAGVRLGLKTILMSLNRSEFEDIKRFAETLGVGFRWDAGIFPRTNGDRAPVKLRVSPQEVVRRDRADPEHMRRWMVLKDRFRGVALGDWLYRCGAARTYFHVDPAGWLTPCLMVSRPRYDLRTGSFADGWQQIHSELRQRKAQDTAPCRQCDLAAICGHCPPFALLETGDEHAPVPYLCEVARLRSAAIEQFRAAARPAGASAPGASP